MMFGQIFLLYLLAGVGVAAAVYLSSETKQRGERWFQLVSALLFWPMYLPLLLVRSEPKKEVTAELPAPPRQDEMATMIAQAERELNAALENLDGWAEAVLARERDQVHELRSAWTLQAERIRAMDRLLAERNGGADADNCLEPPAMENADRRRHTQQVIEENYQRLTYLRNQALADLHNSLAWVRELASSIHVAKFIGAPAARAEELVAQIADAVEVLSAEKRDAGSMQRVFIRKS